MVGETLKTAVAIDIGGTKIAAAIIAVNGTKLSSITVPTPGSTEKIAVEIISLVRQMASLSMQGDGNLKVAGVGLSVAGTVDFARGIIVESPNLPYSNFPLRDIVADSCGLPVFLDNDGNLATLGEKSFGNAANAQNIVGLTLGTGIGAGIIIDGQMYRGADGAAAEIGHMVINAHGPQCTCGSFGCFEEMASGRALVRIARERLAEAKLDFEEKFAPGGDRLEAQQNYLSDSARMEHWPILSAYVDNIDGVTGPIITEAAKSGDMLALQCFSDVGYWLGIGINNIVNIFNPEIIVIGGGMADAGELVLGPARDVVARQSLRPNSDTVSIIKAKLGNDAGLYGAAAQVFLG
jgi:glucokinase